jgi:hypothetical protein
MEEEQGFELEESEQEIDILSEASMGCQLSEDSGGDAGLDLTLDCTDGFSPPTHWEDVAGFTFEADCCPSQTGSTNNSSSVNWQPGVDTGSFIARSVAPVTEQGQVLMANVYLSMKKLERSALKSICTSLGKASLLGEPLARSAASAILCIPSSTLRDVISRLAGNAWQPQQPYKHEAKASLEQFKTVGGRSPATSKIMTTLVREALYNTVRSRPDIEYEHSLCRLSLQGVDIGQKYANHHFVELAEMLAGQYCQILDAEILAQRLPGLGVQSPVGIMFDTVSLGCASFSRHETLEVIILNQVNPRNGRLSSFLMGNPSVPPPASALYFVNTSKPSTKSITIQIPACVLQLELHPSNLE